jgi:hypothetical protein
MTNLALRSAETPAFFRQPGNVIGEEEMEYVIKYDAKFQKTIKATHFGFVTDKKRFCGL